MKHNSATQRQFWKSMAQRFGQRWFDTMGAEPTPEWKSLLDRFTKDDHDNALLLLKDRPERVRGLIPNCAEFESLLTKAANSRAPDGTNYVRTYWRSTIVANCTEALMRAAVIRTPSEFAGYLVENSATIGQPLRRLLDELCEMEEHHQGRRPSGMGVHALQRCRDIIALHIETRSAA